MRLKLPGPIMAELERSAAHRKTNGWEEQKPAEIATEYLKAEMQTLRNTSKPRKASIRLPEGFELLASDLGLRPGDLARMLLWRALMK